MEVVRRARRDLFNVLRRRRRQARVPRVQLGPRPPMARRLLHCVRDAGPVDVHVTNDVVAERSGRRAPPRRRRPTGPDHPPTSRAAAPGRGRGLPVRACRPTGAATRRAAPFLVVGVSPRCRTTPGAPRGALPRWRRSFCFGSGLSVSSVRRVLVVGARGPWLSVRLACPSGGCRGPGAASFRAGRLGVASGRPHAGAAPRQAWYSSLWPRKLALIGQSTHGER